MNSVHEGHEGPGHAEDPAEASRLLQEALRSFAPDGSSGIKQQREPGQKVIDLLGGGSLAVTDPPVLGKKLGPNTWKQDRKSGHPSVVLVFDGAGTFRNERPSAESRGFALEKIPGWAGVELVLILRPRGREWCISDALLAPESELAQTALGALQDSSNWDPSPLDADAPFEVRTWGATDSTHRGTRGVTPEQLAGTLAGITTEFNRFLSARDLVVDPSVQLTALASYLSSQFMIFAGPSGTGKSTLARALTEFFVPETARAVIDARRQLLGPDDLVGFFSPVSDRFVRGPDLSALERVVMVTEDAPCPALLIEEANLSAIEGYLAPFIHAFGGSSCIAVKWHLHEQVSPEDTSLGTDEDGDQPPRDLVLGPFLRVLATVNVDATAPSPSRKVASRACVLLLEPRKEGALDSDLNAALRRVSATAPVDADVDTGRFSRLTGCPTTAAAGLSTDEAEDIKTALRTVISSCTAAGFNLASLLTNRHFAQLWAYVPWFMLLAADSEVAPEERDGIAAAAVQNWLLQFVLPSIPAGAFTPLASALITAFPVDEAPPLGLLVPRLITLQQLGDNVGFGAELDFWDRLS